MRIRIADETRIDLDDGFWFYERQGASLGDYFASIIRGEIEGLRLTAGIQEVVVWAGIDCSRNPEWIRRHLEE